MPGAVAGCCDRAHAGHGVLAGRDLAQACRDGFPRWAAWPLWFLAEAAIVATDIAEGIGTGIGLKLRFGIPLALGVMITALDVFFRQEVVPLLKQFRELSKMMKAMSSGKSVSFGGMRLGKM